MIAIDTSSLSAYFAGEIGPDVEAVELALQEKQVMLPPVVLTEILSDRKIPRVLANLVRGLPLLVPAEGFWERAGVLRAKILAGGFKARLADTLIAQSCIDQHLPLIARDSDYRHFARLGGLKLLIAYR